MAIDLICRSRTKPPDTFRGAWVDLAAKHVDLKNAATCNPSPATIPTTQTWVGAYEYATGKFNIIFADLSEFHLDLP